MAAPATTTTTTTTTTAADEEAKMKKSLKAYMEKTHDAMEKNHSLLVFLAMAAYIFLTVHAARGSGENINGTSLKISKLSDASLYIAIATCFHPWAAPLMAAPPIVYLMLQHQKK